MKIVVASCIAIIALVWIWVSQTNIALVDPSPQATDLISNQVKEVSAQQAAEPSKTHSAPHPHSDSPVGLNEKAHIDHLSPEMKQALKDKLFHHGPKTITKDDKGLIRMDHAGRFVNMPVAVRKADGSIEIKEYSVVPETHTEVTQ
ncbi:MAG: hypothetical protein JXR04_05750 [Bermanella sp.]